MADMKSYKCKMCGYVYRPERGFPVDGIEPGTAFERVPESWTCPVCGASKKDFQPVS